MFNDSIIDNTPGRELVNVIKDQLKKSKLAKFAIGYFFLDGFSLVKEDFPELSEIKERPFLKIVMGTETTRETKEEISSGYKIKEKLKQEMLENLEITDELEKKLNELRDLIAENIVDVRVYVKSKLHAKLYLFITNPEEKYGSPGLAVVGSSNFTAKGLTTNKELNALLTARDDVIYLNQWFDKLWEESEEFREDLLKIIDLVPHRREFGKLVDPETLFKYLVYKWFGDRILNTLNKDILYEFQILGVINAVEKIDNYNGVILADSVGLGKSFIASAIIEEYINGKHPSWTPKGEKPAVMLILPPSIIPQWEELLIKTGNFLSRTEKEVIRNLENDKIYEISDGNNKEPLGKIRFLSLGLFQNMEEDELDKIRKEYHLFIIDEAHKYRNKNTNRWKNVQKIQKKADGFPNKFILLTATPLNNSINDIQNLILLFMDGTFAPFKVRNITAPELFRKYKDLRKKLIKNEDKNIRRELKETASEIKTKILDEIMILRTRKYIMEQFKDIKVNGKPIVFKDPQPYTLDYSPFYVNDYKKLLKLINEKLEQVQFEYTKLYGVRFVVLKAEELTEEEIEGKTEPTSRSETKIIEIADLFKLLLGKRLESSIYAFENTLKKLYNKENIFYKTLKDKVNTIKDKEDLKELLQNAMKEAKIEEEIEEIEEEYEVEEENPGWFDEALKILLEYAEEMEVKGKKYKEIDLIKLGLNKALENIENDLKLMKKILDKLDDLKEKENEKPKTLGKIPKEKEDIIELPIYSYKNEPKLSTLKQIIGNPDHKSEFLNDIPSLNRRKIIIFTQYKDTAYYLYHNLLDWIKRETDLHTWLKDGDKIKIGLVTGETDTSDKINYIKRFAPNANNGYEEVLKDGEIQILISTDALSEGVNLQDADAVINYDLPWNPMVIVQRVGRVNRIGNNKDITVINYIPSDEIEITVGILKKLKEKIKDITLLVGKDVKILSPEEEISIETFGERIKDISKRTITDLEQYKISEDFEEFLKPEIPQEQLDEYKLLNIIQYELKYTQRDFENVMKMNEGPYYTFIEGNDKFISVYEFYREDHRIMKKVISISKDGEIKEDTPLAFLDLLKQKPKEPQFEKALENLKKTNDKSKEIIKELERKYKAEQKGFLADLNKALLAEREKLPTELKDEFWKCVNTLQLLDYHSHSQPLKDKLSGLIEKNKDSIQIKDLEKVITLINEYLIENNISSVKSLETYVKHIGWFYEV